MTDILEQAVTGDEIIIECDLEAAPEKVWRALTVPDLISTWLDVPAAEGKRDGRSGPVYRIVEALPFSRVRYAWHDAAASKPESYVTFDLSPLPDGGTSFRLTHSVEAVANRKIQAANSNDLPPMALAA